MSNVRPLTHEDLVRVLFGSSAFQVLNAGVKLGLFALLHRHPDLTVEKLAEELRLERRPVQILLLGTSALGFTVRTGDVYRNAALLEGMFKDGSWEIIADLVAFEEAFVLPTQIDFTESLQKNTNVGLRRIPGEGSDLYHRLAGHPELQQLFYRCMRSWSRLSNPILVAKANLSGVKRVLDVGGGDGVNAIALAQANPGVRFTVLDLPGALQIAKEKIARAGLTDRIQLMDGDIFQSNYPADHDAILFANQLVIWSPEQNLSLLRKAHESLVAGGRVLIFNAFSDDSGDGPLYAALDNVYFATLTAGSSSLYPWAEYEKWLSAVGFSGIERLPGGTWTPHGVISARKAR